MDEKSWTYRNLTVIAHYSCIPVSNCHKDVHFFVQNSFEYVDSSQRQVLKQLATIHHVANNAQVPDTFAGPMSLRQVMGDVEQHA